MNVLEDCLFCRTKENISIVDTIPLCNGCCNIYRESRNKVKLIEGYIKEKVRDYEYERSALATRMYVLIHNQSKHLIETDEDCMNHKESAQYHLKRAKMLINHPFVRLKYLFIQK